MMRQRLKAGEGAFDRNALKRSKPKQSNPCYAEVIKELVCFRNRLWAVGT